MSHGWVQTTAKRVLSPRWWRVVPVGAAAIGLVAACTSSPPTGQPLPPTPAMKTLAIWTMDETAGPTMHDTVKPNQNGRMGRGVTPGAGVFQFPGWAANVDATGRLQGSISDTDGEVVVRDRTHVLEPTNDLFGVSGTIRSRLTAAGQLPIGAPGTSFNVIQKARSNNQGGFWKVEIGGSGRTRGRLICTIGDGVRVVVVASPNPVADGGWHRFACWLGRGLLVAQVDAQGSTADASLLTTIDPVARFSGGVVLGKKPGSTDPGDAFSGWLGEVSISGG